MDVPASWIHVLVNVPLDCDTILAIGILVWLLRKR